MWIWSIELIQFKKILTPNRKMNKFFVMNETIVEISNFFFQLFSKCTEFAVCTPIYLRILIILTNLFCVFFLLWMQHWTEFIRLPLIYMGSNYAENGKYFWKIWQIVTTTEMCSSCAYFKYIHICLCTLFFRKKTSTMADMDDKKST